MRGRTLLGSGQWVDSYGNVIYKLGDIGGERLHRLTLSEIPSHNHTSSGTAVLLDKWQSSGFGFYAMNVSGGVLTQTINLQSAGNDQAHNIMMPYMTVHWIIKM